MRRFRLGLTAVLAMAAAAVAVAPPAQAAAPPPGQATRYTMTAFTNSSESNMYVYESPDATGFRLLRGPAFTPPTGLIRDPSIIRHTDGFYYIVYTTNWTGNTIGFARSSDRLNWTFLRNHTIPLTVQNTWAPEWFIDTNGSVNIIVSLSTNGADFKPHRLTATNSSLTAWSAPAVLSGIGPNYIDTYIVKIGSTYHAFTKQETTKFIEYATASSLTGPYTFRRTGNWAGWGGPREGQALVPLDNGGWRIFFDGYTIGQYLFSDSYDTFQTWTAPQQLPGLSGFARHFTVLKEVVSGGVTLPSGSARSFQSTNFPSRYLSSRTNLGFLDTVSSSSTAAVKQAATVSIVPGLADANCYSFTVGGRYLRHYDYRARFDTNDGTGVFRQDATFCARPGAVGGSVMLESYNFPGRYLRHRNYELWVDLYQDTALFRSDSSFTAVTAWGTAVAAQAMPAAAAYAAYVMGYFTESPSQQGANYGLHLAVSADSLNWTPLNQNNAVVTPTAGTRGLRDPYFLRKQDGTFVVLATDLNGTDFTQPNQFIHAWDSVDLTSFTNYRRLRMHTLNTHTWAPEAFYDPARGQYGIFYSVFNGTRDVFFVNYTTDFVTVSAPQLFFDPGFSVLDGTMLTEGGVNYLYYKNLANGLLYGARSNTLNPGSFTTYTGGHIQGNGIEAPIVVKSLTSNTFYLWGDSYSPANGRFYAWQSTNLSGGSWSVLNQRAYTQPLNSKHATIMPITADEQTRLLSRWGSPAWSRLKSYNFPDRYVRHQNFVPRIDTYPFDPFSDQQWRMVPGLSDAAGVSFESVNFPGRYLRQLNFALRLDPRDSSAAFNADATFYRVPGFADASWSSFRSASNPTRYIRHFNYVLRIDPITSGSSTVDRQDATFRVLT